MSVLLGSGVGMEKGRYFPLSYYKMPLCVITTEGLNYSFPQPTCFSLPPQSAYCQLEQELAYLKPTTSLSKSQQGVRKASAEFTHWHKGHALKTPWGPIESLVH